MKSDRVFIPLEFKYIDDKLFPRGTRSAMVRAVYEICKKDNEFYNRILNKVAEYKIGRSFLSVNN